jgi:hypothetical protein
MREGRAPGSGDAALDAFGPGGRAAPPGRGQSSTNVACTVTRISFLRDEVS